MKKRLLSLVLCLVMVFSLLPVGTQAVTTLDNAMVDDDEYVYQQTGTETVSAGDPVPTGEYYTYVNGEYVSVTFQTGTVYEYTESGKTQWNAKNDIGTSTAYYFNDGTGYYPVKAVRGTLDYTKAYDAGKDIGNWLVGISTDYSTSWYTRKNAGNYYVYDATYDDAFYVIIREKGHAGGYYERFFYLPNYSPKITETNAEDYVYHSTSLFSSSDPALVAFNNKQHVDIPVSGSNTENGVQANITRSTLSLGIGGVNSSNHFFDAAVYTHTSTTGYNAIYYTKNGTDIQLGKTIKVDADLQYAYKNENGPLYTRFEKQNVVTSVTVNGQTYSSEVYGQTLYSNPIYTRVGKLGDVQGYKSLEANGDAYDLTIDSWATGNYQKFMEASGSGSATTTVETTTVEKKVPLDIVLVVDQSGSMGTADMGEAITGYTMVQHEGSTWTEDQIHNGTVYYCKVGDRYYPVQTETGNVYTKANSMRGNKTFGYGHDGVSVMVNGSPVHYNVPTNYYVQYNGEMHKLFFITVGKDLEYGLYPYIYTDDNGTNAKKSEWKDNIYWVAIFRPWSAKLLKDNDTWKSIINDSAIRWVDSNGQTLDPTDSNGDSVKTEYRRVFGIGITDAYYMKNLYTVADQGTTGLYYVNGSEKVYISNIRTMGEDDFTLNENCDGHLYVAESDTTRVQALRKAAEDFAMSLAQNAKVNEVNHRLAIVGFAGNRFPSYSSGETAVHNTTTTREYTDTGVFLNNDFINYESVDGYTQVSGVNSTDGLYLNKHYYLKDSSGNYQPIGYNYSKDRWYYTDTGEWLTTAGGSYRGTFYQANMDAITATQYQNALVSVYDSDDSYHYNYNNKAYESGSNEVNDTVDKAIDNFGYYGGTYTSYGLAMANQIFANATTQDAGTQITTTTVTVNDVAQEPQVVTESVPGQRIIVVFTDGEPGARGYEANIANEALAGAVESKTEYGAKVYTVGLYPEDVSSQVESFMHQLSSEYTANIAPIGAGSDLAVSTALRGNTTYYYKDTDGKFYAVTATRNGVSSLGWWEHNSNSYSLLNVEGKNGAGEHAIYDASGNQVYGEDANTSSTYYSSDGDPVRYEYRWYNADRSIVEPNISTGGTGSETNRVQFYEIQNQTANTDGESYYTRVQTGTALISALSAVVSSNQSGTTTTSTTTVVESTSKASSYEKTDLAVKDAISASFDVPDNATVSVQVVPCSGFSGTVTGQGIVNDSDNLAKPAESGAATPVFNNVAVSTLKSGNQTSGDYTLSYDSASKTVTVTGFDFSGHYIGGNDGALLRVLVSGLTPTGTGTLYSNVPAKSGIYENFDNNEKLFTYNDPSVVVETYTVTWINGDQVLETDYDVERNAAPSYESGEPMRAPKTVDNGNGTISTTTYTFAGWSEDANASAAQVVNLANEKITKDTTYYAIFSETTTETRNAFIVKWNNGSLLEQDDDVAAGTVPEYNSAEPVNGEMVFVGWTTDASDTTLTNQRIDDGNFPANFAVQPNLPVEYYPCDDNGVVNFYAVFMAKGLVTEFTKKVVVEYSTKNLIDSGVYEFETDRSTAGTFIKEKTADVEIGSKGTVEVGNLFFVPKMQQTDSFAYDLTPMSGVSTAKYYTDASVEQWNVNKTLTTVTVIAGSSIYLDDSLMKTAASMADYQTNLNVTGLNVNSTDTVAKGEGLRMTFFGSRIDVYCTTTTDGKSVRAYVTDSTGKILKSVSMKNQSIDERYNVPTISFDLGTVGEYTLVISNPYEDYKLDGVRVYKPYADETYYADNEKNAHFIKLRDKLVESLNQKIADAGDEPITDTVAFFTDKGDNPTLADYIVDGPKNEIYLSEGETVAFEIQDYASYPANAKVMVGLSVQANDSANVSLNGKPTTIYSDVDVYYDINVEKTGEACGVVAITNTSGARVAVTNLKISGVAADFDPSVNYKAATVLAVTEAETEAFEPVVMVSSRLMRFMENPVFTEADSEPSPTPTPDPTPDPTHQPTIQELIRQLFSDFVKNLFSSIGRLFGN